MLAWSLALGVEPLSHLGLGGMAAIVLGGLVLNGLIPSRLAAWLRRSRYRPTARAVSAGARTESAGMRSAPASESSTIVRRDTGTT